MRQLTASQKIAILENRVAQLEKQAIFNVIQKKLNGFVKGLKPLRLAQEAVQDSGMTPKDLVQLQEKLSRKPEYKELEKRIKGMKPDIQIKVLVNELEKTKQTSKLGYFGSGIFPEGTESLKFYLLGLLLIASTRYLVFKLEDFIGSIKEIKTEESLFKKVGKNLLLAVAYLLYGTSHGLKMIGRFLYEWTTFIPNLLTPKSMRIEVDDLDPPRRKQ